MKVKVHRPAIVINRIGATLIDMFLISLLYGAIVAIMTGNYRAIVSRFDISFGDYRLDLLLVVSLGFINFVVIPPLWNGYTIGKRFTRTRLVTREGERITFPATLLRFVSIVVPGVLFLGIPLIINVYMMLFRSDNRGYHDMIAKTKIVSMV